MTGPPSGLRFFRVVRPVSSLMLGAFAVAVSIGVATSMLKPAGAGDALAPVLLLQMLAVSSGFAVPARRGYYDLPLTAGFSRTRLALIHWVSSCAPGVAAWTAIAAAECAATGTVATRSLSSGTVVAMFAVSTLPWAVTVPLPRLTGGIGWLLVLAIVVSALPSAGRAVLLDGIFTAHGAAAATAAVLLCPWLLAGRAVSSPPEVLPAAVVLAAGASAMIVALRWIHRADIPLEAAQ